MADIVVESMVVDAVVAAEGHDLGVCRVLLLLLVLVSVVLAVLENIESKPGGSWMELN